MAGAVRCRTYCHSLAKKSGDDFPRSGIVGVDSRSIAMFIFETELPILRLRSPRSGGSTK
jgi:hypothetical protein